MRAHHVLLLSLCLLAAAYAVLLFVYQPLRRLASR